MVAGDVFSRLCAIGRPDLAKRYKHLSGKHDQRTHGWRYAKGGSDADRLSAARRSMRGTSAEQRATYRKRAGMPEARPLERKPPGPPPPASASKARQIILDIEARWAAKLNPLEEKANAARTAAKELMDRRKAAVEKSGTRQTDVGAGFFDKVFDDPNGGIRTEYYHYVDEARELNRQHKALKDQAAKEMREALYVDDPASITILSAAFKKGDPRMEAITTGVGEVEKLVSASVFDGAEVRFVPGKGRRAVARGREVGLPKRTGIATIVHEMGHVLEYNIPSVGQKAAEFLERRTKGERTVPMRSVSSHEGWGRHERTKPDKFVEPYMGKQYFIGEKRIATEILSMGLEMFFADPAKLAREDPDYFGFIFNLVRGN